MYSVVKDRSEFKAVVQVGDDTLYEATLNEYGQVKAVFYPGAGGRRPRLLSQSSYGPLWNLIRRAIAEYDGD